MLNQRHLNGVNILVLPFTDEGAALTSHSHDRSFYRTTIDYT